MSSENNHKFAPNLMDNNFSPFFELLVLNYEFKVM
jgi:hypothetical protein